MSDLEHPIEGDPCGIDWTAPECAETGLYVVVCELCDLHSTPRDHVYARYTVLTHTATKRHQRRLRNRQARQ